MADREIPSNFNFPPDGRKRQFLWEEWPSVFEPPQSMFAPGEPLFPVEQEQVRSYDFPVGINQIIYPRVPELFDFSQLRAFANVELVRLAIETRKDQVESVDWQINTRDRTDRKGMPKKRKDAIDRIKKVEKFLNKPNQSDDLHVWLRTIMEDLLVLDAPAIEKRKTRGEELYSLDYIPGDTIKVLVDHNGRRPQAPAPAYQQIIKGRVWANLEQGDIIYSPRNPRSGKLYGFGPVEQCIVTINTIMRRQASQLAYFTDGTIPAGLATTPDGWTAENLKDWQEWQDSIMAGNLAERRKLLWAPHGCNYIPFKESPLKDDYDEWLARIICFCFSLPPTPFIKQMNRSTAVQDNERSLKEGLAPLLGWAKRLFDGIIHDDFGFHDLEFSWNIDEEIDLQTKANVDNLYLRAGVITINELRDELGEEGIGPDGDEHLIYTAGGAITIENILNPPMTENVGVDSGKPQVDTKPQSDAKIEDDRVKEIADIVGGIDQLRKPLLSIMQKRSYTNYLSLGA